VRGGAGLREEKKKKRGEDAYLGVEFKQKINGTADLEFVNPYTETGKTMFKGRAEERMRGREARAD